MEQNNKGRIIAIINQKGGVGKTETALNLAYGLGEIKGKRILFIDLDSQANSTKIIMENKNNIIPDNGAKEYKEVFDEFFKKTNDKFASASLALDRIVSKKGFKYDIHDVLEEKANINDVILKTRFENIDLIPASGCLEMTDAELKRDLCDNPSLRLRSALDELETEYDYIIVDNQPFMNTLIYNSIAACCNPGDLVIIPVKINRGGLEGVESTINVITKWVTRNRRAFNWKGDIRILHTIRNSTVKTDREWYEIFRESFGDCMFRTSIRNQSGPVTNASMQNKILLEFDPKQKCKVTQEYLNLVEEISNYGIN